MSTEQPAEEIEYLVDQVRKIKTDLLRNHPFYIQQEIEFELESFGYDFIISHAIRKNELSYLTKCMFNYRQKLLVRRNKKLHKYRDISEDIEFSADEEFEEGNEILDKLYFATLKLTPRQKELVYWFVVIICKGSIRPIGDLSDNIGCERHAVQRALNAWKAAYATEIRREVPKVRSLRHLSKLLYIEYRKSIANNPVDSPLSRELRHSVGLGDPTVPTQKVGFKVGQGALDVLGKVLSREGQETAKEPC